MIGIVCLLVYYQCVAIAVTRSWEMVQITDVFLSVFNDIFVHMYFQNISMILAVNINDYLRI